MTVELPTESRGLWVGLADSRRFVRLASVTDAQWLFQDDDRGWEANPRWIRTWRLAVTTIATHFVLYGQDAVDLLDALKLPHGIPTEGPGG